MESTVKRSLCEKKELPAKQHCSQSRTLQVLFQRGVSVTPHPYQKLRDVSPMNRTDEATVTDAPEENESVQTSSRPEVRRTYSRKKSSEYPSDESHGRMNIEEKEEEKTHFLRVLSAFKHYKFFLEEQIRKRINNVKSLPPSQQMLIQSYTQSLYDVKKCINHNQDLLKLVIKDAELMFENLNLTNDGIVERCKHQPSVVELERVQVTLKLLVRDWSEDGAPERKACYQPIIKEITSYFPATKRLAESVKVLVPGSGLGRLAYEIASKGYTCQGNEFSLFMLIASNFVLNKTSGINTYSVYPWIYQFENNMSPEDQMHLVRFPDVYPNTILKRFSSRFTMAAGDFLEIYQTPSEWDCVATCFFIDCAHNIVEFVEQIYKILKPGGIWVNLGPLLYHYSNSTLEFSIEPQYSSVREIITGVGFVIEKEETNVRTPYIQNPRSMAHYEYKCVFFVCRKPAS